MNQINGRRKLDLCAILAVLTSILLLVGLGVGISAMKTSEKIRDERLESLYQAEGKYSKDTIILRNVPLSRAETLADKLHARLRTTPQGDFSVLYLPEGVTIEDVYQDDTNLAYIPELEPDFYADVQAMNATGQELIVSPPEYSVSDPLYESITQLEYLHMGNVWEKTRGAGVTVAIIDTGIDTDHPEFSGRISDWSYNASEDKTVHDYGISVIEDPDGHGTAVAGVIGASLNNGVGITGVAPEVELLIIRCECDESGSFVRSSDLVFGLAYAIERDADVINMSFSTSGINIFEEYTKLAVDSDIICVAAAGNDGSSLAVYPAADPNVIGVGGFDTQTWSLADFSNYGDNSDLLAPGVVYTTDLDGGYAVRTGTSMSSPMVAGAVALYLSVNPYQELADIRMILEASSVDLGTLGEDWVNGFGALDIYAAVCGDMGTITYDMLTDEISSQTQKFVRGRTVQIMPEPERQNVVFDGWYYDAQCTDECEYYTEFFNQDITLYASWINEDEGTPYLYTVLDDGTAEIRSYFGKRRYLTVPDQIEGYTVSSIGENAFAGNTRLREVKLPNTLTNIGQRAFYNCTALLSIEIPEQVQNIGAHAFNGCVRLQTVGIVPNGDLMGIGDRAFSECGISSFLIPEKLNFLGEASWLGSANMRTIAVAEGNTSFRMINHALYDMSGETLIYCPPALSGEYTVAAGTTAIKEYAFYRSRFTVIEFPESLCSIGDSGFAKSHITSVAIPSSVTQLGESVWLGCNNLSTVELDAAEGLRGLPRAAFSNCGSLRSIRIPYWFQSLGSSAFDYSGLEEIVFEEGSQLSTIGTNAFKGSQLKQITVPAGVKAIANSTFSHCAALTEINLAADSLLNTIGDLAFQNCCSLKQIQFPESLTTVGPQAFYKSGLTQLHLGKNISRLGKGAFAYCSKLPLITVSEENEAFAAPDGVLMSKDGKRLLTYPAGREGTYALPDTVTEIADYGFSGAAQLTEVILDQNLVTISAYAFEYCGRMQTPVLPESLTSIGEFSFSYCTSMSEMLLLPKNVISLGRYAFTQDYNLSQIVIAQDSVLSRISYGTFANCGITDFRIPASITSMGQEVFTGCKYLKKVTFSTGCKLEFLPAWTFRGATALKEIFFEENCALRKIEARALEQQHMLTSINLEKLESLEVIDNYAFQDCRGLTSIKLPSTVVEIGRYAFSGCDALKQIIIPEKTEFIGRYAFAGTCNLKVYFEASVLPLNLQEYWDYDIFGFYLGTGNLLKSGDWTYTLTHEGEASIVSYKGSAADLTIDTIDGHPVVAIGMGAFMNNTTLKTVELPDTLLGIYKNAFAGTTALTEITIPDTVTVIDESAFRESGISEVNFGADSQLAVLGRSAFENTASLTSFTLPEGVERIRDDTFSGSGLQTFSLEAGSKLTEIGRRAFADSGLLGIELPDGLTKIDHYAFAGSVNLKSVSFGTDAELVVYSNAFYQTGLEMVEIPANLTYLGEFCFTDCQNLTTITVVEENIWYASVDGVLYSKDLSRLICCPAGKTGEISIPDDVTALAFGAFEGSDLSGIYFSDSSRLSTLGYRTFFRCDKLEQITIPDGLLSIDRYAFAYCPNLATVNIGEGSQLSCIGYAAFYQCPSLTSIYISAGVHEIDDYAFYDCFSLTNLNIAEDSQLKFIGNFAFQNTAVTELIMPEELYEIGNYAFQNSGMDTLVVNEKVFWIGDYAFADCGLANTTVLTFPENMEYLGNTMLKGATAIQELTIPFLGNTVSDPFKLVDLVGDSSSAFSTPKTLHTVNVLHGDIAPLAFIHQNQVKTVTLGDDCRSIEYNAFTYSGITSIHLPSSLAMLGTGALSECSELQSVTLAEGNTYFEMVDGVLYDEAVTKAIFAPTLLTGEIRIPNTVTKIGDSAFRGCGKITGLILPESLKEIGGNAFYNCTSLTEIMIPDSVTTLGVQSFYGCSRAKTIVVGAGVKEIPWETFRNCGTAGCDVELGENVEKIGMSALAGCGMKNITIPDLVKIIEHGTFNGCKKLELVAMGSSVETIAGNAFYSCTKLAEVILTDSLHTIGNNAFDGSGIMSIQIPKNVSSIGQGALSNCARLETIEVHPDNVNYCSQDGCLYNGNKTELLAVPAKISGTVRIPEGVVKLGDYTFSKCSLLEEIIIPDTVTEIGGACFSNCTSLAKVSLPKQLTTLSWSVFDYCTSLQEIEIPDSITTMGNYTFRGCSALTSVILPEALTTLGEGCFQRCTALDEIHVGPNITFIGLRAFENSGYYNNADNWEGAVLYLDDLCIAGKVDEQKIIRIKEGTRLIAVSAFMSNSVDSVVETVILPDSVLHICNTAFFNNDNLRIMRMSSNVQTIGSQALSNRRLRSIHIPGSVRNAGNFLGNPTGDAYPELRYVLIEDGACLEGIRFTGSPNMNTMVVPYDSEASMKTILNQYNPVVLKNLVVTGNKLSAEFLYGVDSSTDIYCQVPEGYFSFSGSNTIYYVGQWYMAEFWSDGALVQVTPYPRGAVVEVPSSATTELYALDNDVFLGWDINGDGEADQIPAMLSGDLEAVALWGHVHTVVTDPTVAPTCTTTGLTEGSHCATCGQVIVPQQEIPMTNHKYQADTTEPTCTGQGFTTHTCANCSDSYVDTYVDALGHAMGDWTTVMEATCTVDGSEHRDCSRCDHYEIRTIKALGHAMDEWITVTEATCTENGSERRDCSRCGHYETRTIKAAGHSYESVVTAPTCMAQGYTNHTCTVCGDSYVDTYVDALGHNMGNWTTVTEATCTDDGSERQDCSRCDHHETRTIEAIGHSFGAWFVNRSATCTEDGENRRNCSACGHYEMEVIPATGHSYESVVTAPTCTEQGYTTHTCANCGDSYVDTYVDALGHDMGNWTTVTEATCTEDGSERQDCSRCNHYETRTIDATGHSFGAWFVNRSATCTKDGESRRNCSNCSHYETEIIPATGHDYESVVTAPTCVDQGYTTHTCANCGDSYVDTYVDALGHDMGNWTTITEATCAEDGSERRDCSRCDHYEIRAIEAAGHSYEHVVTAPTCTEQGFVTHTCSACGDSYVDTYVDALGHDMGNWTTVTEATCTDDGSERRDCSHCDHYETRIIKATGHSFGAWFVNRAATCTEEGENRRNCANCSHYETEVIPATGHSYESVVTAPTCVEKGYTTHTCTVCGDSYVDSCVDALGHDMGEWSTVSEATCTEDGQELRECTRCDHYETRIIEAPGHSYDAAVTKPTCTEQGYTRYVCSVCGDSYISDYMAPTGHTHDEVVTDPTCTEQGYTTYICHCGDRYVSDYTDPLGHNMGAWEIFNDATCTEDGQELRECSLCDHSETREIEALGHEWDEGIVTVEPTEETEGEMTYTCERCSETRTEIIPEMEHEHRYETVITDPTCIERGYTTHTCRCGDSYVDSYVDALGHDMGEWFNVTEPTCTADGLKQRDCSHCDYHEAQVIEATGHDYESVVTESTCTAQGFTTHTCANCGDSYTDSYTAALGHSFTDYVCDGNTTCTEDGTKTAVCDRCDATDTVIDEGSAYGHDFTEWTMVQKPTETVEGLESRYCLNCGVEETRTIARQENPFNDVAPGSFFYEPVMWAIENGITNGTSATTFGPNDQCMRAHVVTFLWRAVGSPEPTRTANPFVDVKPTDFYYKPVLWAVENGITSGMDSTHFGPTAYCNRAQVVTFLYRTMGNPEIATTANPFTDVVEDSFYEKPVLWAVENGITNGLDATHFGPNTICNRAQIVTFLYRAFVD